MTLLTKMMIIRLIANFMINTRFNPRVMTKFVFSIVLLALFMITGCRSGGKQTDTSNDGFIMMIEHIEQNIDFVNLPEAPGSIDIQKVINYSGSGLHLIDLRSAAEYDEGHLPETVNIEMAKLLSYFEDVIDPGSFDTIVLISNDGQDAFFATTLLRILGYENVFGLRLGMGWHIKYADKLIRSRLSSEYEDKLITDPSPNKLEYSYPVVQTTHIDGYSLIRERVAELLETGYKDYRITAGELIAAADSFYIINYWTPQEYESGHIPGAYQYNPKKSLARAEQLQTVPSDRPVVIYCHQGNMSASATAYMRLLGYNVFSMEFGTNSFMYNHHRDKGIRNLFEPDKAIDYPLRDKHSKPGESPEVPVLIETRGQGGC